MHAHILSGSILFLVQISFSFSFNFVIVHQDLMTTPKTDKLKFTQIYAKDKVELQHYRNKQSDAQL